MTKASLIDITTEESTTVGKLMDLLHEHLNEYELTAAELETLNQAEEVLYRIWFLHKDK